MNIEGYIRDARVLISQLLEDTESTATVADAPYSQESVRCRKWYWNCTRASRELSELSTHQFPDYTEEQMEREIAQQSSVSTPTYWAGPPAAQNGGAVGRYLASAYVPPSAAARSSSVNRNTSVSYSRPHTAGASSRNDQNNNTFEKLNMDGFAAIKPFLTQITCGRRAKRPYMSLGELGMAEGWTTILTNAAYCYDNTPADGWRREVAIRMSGKSRGSVDIHYVTPDKRRRFRSRQELQSYLSRVAASVDFINKFDFRAVFCLCHNNEDTSRSYLECSYGLAGCNRWIHPECVGLGVRSEQELSLMPKVICPCCAKYLEGTGEMATVRTPDMLILKSVTLDARELEEEHADEIEESDQPHVLWGLQGSPYVYCSLSGASGLDALKEDTSNADQNASNSMPVSSHQRSPSSSSSQTISAAALSGAASEMTGILQHRLFQNWLGAGSTAPSDRGSTGAFSTEDAEQRGSPAKKKRVEEEEEEEKIKSDDDEGVPSNRAQLEPQDRVRMARNEDGSTTMVRVEGGWMVRKKEKAETDKPDSADGLLTATMSVGNGTELGGVAGAAAEEAPDAADIRRRVLEKAAARAASRDAPKSNLSARYKKEAIEAAITAAQSTSHKKKTGYNASTIAAIAAGYASSGVIAQTQEEVRVAHEAKSSLCFLPLEDGSVRFGSVSFAQVPRSVHALCQTSLLCGACLHPFEESAASTSVPNAVAKPPRKNAKKRLAEAEVDRHQRVMMTCGAVTYPVHRQCEHAVAGDFLGMKVGRALQQAAEKKIILAETYSYDEPDDAECDLCGRKGGFMRYFQLSSTCSSVPVPAEEGWLAHIPCIQYLQVSSQLELLGERNDTAAILSRFEANPWSCRISSTEQESESTAAITPVTTQETTPMVVDEERSQSELTADAGEKPQEESVEPKEDSESDSESGEDGAKKALREKLLRANLLRDGAPLSAFDQQLGQWRCTLCGLQCGVTARCMGAGCTLRAHPLCVTVSNHPLWRMCAVTGEKADGAGHRGGKSVSVGALCPLHSAALQK